MSTSQSSLGNNIHVLPKGYVGKRQPEAWSLEKLMDNMNKALEMPSSYDLTTKKIERGRGPRNVYTMVVEHLHGNPVVKVYYDWDFPCTGLTAFTDINTKEELRTVKAQVKEIEQEQLVMFKIALKRAHPELPESSFVFGRRTGWKVKRSALGQSPKKTSSGWFVSLRCFVQGLSMRVGDIRRHIDNVFAKDEFPQLDRNVYKETEQCLALVGGHKEAGDKRVLVPITETEDLEPFIVQSIANCELFQPAQTIVVPVVPQKRSSPSTRCAWASPQPGGIRRAEGPQEEHSAPGGSSSRARCVEPDLSGNRSVVFLEWMRNMFDVDPTLVLLDKIKILQNNVFTIPTSARQCPFAKREHNSNHIYFTVCHNIDRDTVNVQLKCHDSDCAHRSNMVTVDSSSHEVQQTLISYTRRSPISPRGTPDDEVVDTAPIELSAETEITIDMKKETVRESLVEFQKMYPQMDCTIDDDDDILQPTTLGNGGFMTYLKKNHFCPLHTRMHDTCENCVLHSTQESVQNGVVVNNVKQQLLCRRDMNVTLPYPMNKSQTNIIFNNVNINTINNINVIQSETAAEVRDFGGLEHFPQLFPDDNLNLLCYKSLSGRTISFAKFAAEMVKGKYVFQDNTWYHFRGRVWTKDPGPDDLIGTELLEIYERLTAVYNTPQQLKWLNLLINDLGNLNKRKPYTEELERHVTREMEDNRIPFDESPHLIGFQNGVFDTRSCVFRKHQAEDYLTVLQPYALPDKPEEHFLTQINDFFDDLLPSQQVREYVMLLLALHLEGSNKHAIGMIWSGTGGNGKSVLKDLMNHTFGPLHAEPPATFLTSERPSPEKPAPHLVDLRYKRSVITSEPEVGKKTNSAFLKFITGNDKVTCRALHSNDMISFVPRFIVTLLCNVIPLFQGGQDEVRALWRRLKIIEFPTEFVDVLEESKPNQRLRDGDLPEKLPLWAPSFMAMLINIYQEYVRGGRRLRAAPPEVERNLEEQMAENNPLERFVKECLVASPGHFIHTHAITTQFLNYRRQNDIRSEHTDTVTSITRRLEAMGYTVSQDKKNYRACCTNPSRALLDFTFT